MHETVAVAVPLAPVAVLVAVTVNEYVLNPAANCTSIVARFGLTILALGGAFTFQEYEKVAPGLLASVATAEMRASGKVTCWLAGLRAIVMLPLGLGAPAGC